MTAIFNFQALLMVFLLLICTCAYVHQQIPSIMDRRKDGLVSLESHKIDAPLYMDSYLTLIQYLWPILEVRADRGAFESLHKHMLPAHGRNTHCGQLNEDASWTYCMALWLIRRIYQKTGTRKGPKSTD